MHDFMSDQQSRKVDNEREDSGEKKNRMMMMKEEKEEAKERVGDRTRTYENTIFQSYTRDA